VEINGSTYKTQVLVAIKPSTPSEEPLFGLILEIYVVGSSIHFYMQEMETMEYTVYTLPKLPNNSS
jgi:hypothetical protein